MTEKAKLPELVITPELIERGHKRNRTERINLESTYAAMNKAEIIGREDQLLAALTLLAEKDKKIERLGAWLSEIVEETEPPKPGCPHGYPSDKADAASRSKFDRLVGEWQKESALQSTSIAAAMHPSYQKMIGMGKEALPLIFERIATEGDEPNDWFWALAAIADDNPVPQESRGRIAKMAKAWLDWGRENGYALAKEEK